MGRGVLLFYSLGSLQGPAFLYRDLGGQWEEVGCCPSLNWVLTPSPCSDGCPSVPPMAATQCPLLPSCPLILKADGAMTFGGHRKTEVNAWFFVTVPGILAWLSSRGDGCPGTFTRKLLIRHHTGMRGEERIVPSIQLSS